MAAGVSSQSKKIAVVGAGMVSETHLRAIADLSEKVNLVGVCARSDQSALNFSDHARAVLGSPVRIYNELDEIAEDNEVDFVIVLTPPNARTDVIITLAMAGKHILAEKPVERTSAAAEKIVETCEAANVRLGVVFQHRARASSKKLKSMMQSGQFGNLCIVEAKVPWWREQSYYDEPGRGSYERDGGGVLISQAIHTLDLMLSFTGPVREVQAFARTSALHEMEAEDYVCAGLEFDSGAYGSVIASTATYPGEAESIMLQFDKAAILLQSGELKISWRDGRTEEYGEPTSTGGGADPMAFTHDWHRAIIEDFVGALDEDREPMCSGREALQVHSLIDAIVLSSNEKKAVSVQSLGDALT